MTYRNYLQQQADAGQSAAVPLLNMVGDDGKFGTSQWQDPNTGRIYSQAGESGNANAFFWERYNNSGPGAIGNDSAANPPQYDTVGTYGNVNSGPSEAELAKIAAQNAARDKVAQGQKATFESANDAASAWNKKQTQAAKDFGVQYGLDMDALNSQYTQAEAGKMSAYSGIMDMINRGIKSGNTMLAGRNASRSSAADAIARAYSELGNREASGVEQDYQLDMESLGRQYNALTAGKKSFEEGIQTETDLEIGKIVQDARDALYKLNEIYADADISDRLQVDQLKEQVRQEARAKVGELQKFAQTQTAGIDRNSETQRMQSAREFRQAGGLGKAYDYRAEAPVATNSGGGVGRGNLPIYSNLRARSKDERR